MPFLQTTTARLTLFTLLTALGLMAFWPAVHHVVDSVLNRQGSSHGVFIPFLSAYFVYLKWERLKKRAFHYCLPGALAAALLLTIPRIVPESLELQFITSILYMAAVILLCLGKPLFKECAFPVLFLATMVPIPRDIYDGMAEITRHITFGLSLGILSIFDIPFYREGWLIRLPNALLEVAISCSGIRYLISYFVFGIAYAYLFRKTSLSRLLLVVSTIPISIAASTLRLTIIFLATHYISPQMAEYWPHITLSWIVFFTVLFGLISLDQYRLNRKSDPIITGAAQSDP